MPVAAFHERGEVLAVEVGIPWLGPQGVKCRDVAVVARVDDVDAPEAADVVERQHPVVIEAPPGPQVRLGGRVVERKRTAGFVDGEATGHPEMDDQFPRWSTVGARVEVEQQILAASTGADDLRADGVECRCELCRPMGTCVDDRCVDQLWFELSTDRLDLGQFGHGCTLRPPRPPRDATGRLSRPCPTITPTPRTPPSPP